MLRFAADENFNKAIIRALLIRSPDLDLVWIQDVRLSGESDPIILGWAATENRILLTHDITTITRCAYGRGGLFMPGVIEIPCHAHFKQTLDDLALLITCSEQNEWNNHIIFLPL